MLTIDHPEAERLATELARRTGETIPEAIARAVRERLSRVAAPVAPDPELKGRLLRIARHCAALPDLDTRSPEEILGYDEIGLPR